MRAGIEFVVDPRLEVRHRAPATSAAARVARAFVSGASWRRFEQVHPESRDGSSVACGGPKSCLWNLALAVVSRTARSPRGFGRLGGAADRLLRALPRRAGHVLVALLVEAAARAGRRRGSDDLTVYRPERARRIVEELRSAGA